METKSVGRTIMYYYVNTGGTLYITRKTSYIEDTNFDITHKTKFPFIFSKLFTFISHEKLTQIHF